MTRDLQHIPIDRLALSRFNSRKTRSPEQVARLADRIRRNGFEATRALWAVPAGDGYEVFAGGTRLEAARAAGLASVPVFVFGRITDEEIARLESQDNEDDEYHEKVSPLDVWAECWRLNRFEGWTQQRIEDAKGWKQQNVAMRCRLHTDLCDAAKKAVSADLFDEGHAEAISGVVSAGGYFALWLTTSQARPSARVR